MPDGARRTPGAADQQDTPAALGGFTVAVVADRRHDDLAGGLRQQGARVVTAPPLRIVPLVEDAELRLATEALITDPPDILATTPGIELTGWLAAARDWGLGDRLDRALRRAVRISVPPDGEPVPVELLASAVAGERIAVGLLGDGGSELTSALHATGAAVVVVPLHRWVPPADPTPLRRVVDLTLGRLTDAVVCTSAPAVGALLRVAEHDTAGFIGGLRTGVLAAGLTADSAAPLVGLEVPVLVPAEPTAAGLIAALAQQLPARAPRLQVAGRDLVLRGHAAVLDGALYPLAPAPMAMLRALAAAPGRVLTRAALLHALPRSGDEHAVEMAVARLRAAFGTPALVQTVARRGYRLRVD